MPINSNILSTFNGPTQLTATGGTAFAGLLNPYPGPPGPAPLIQTVFPNRRVGDGVLHLTKFMYSTGGSTAQLLTFMRPLNYTYFTATFPKNTTVLDNYIKDDPGIYTANYKYNGGIFPAQVADAAISSTNKYVAYQLADGTWILDTIASGTFGSTLTLTTGTPNRTYGTVAAGSPLYYFGTVTLKDPATGQLNPQTTMAASTTQGTAIQNVATEGIWSALHHGDPMVFYSANSTNAGFLEWAAGYYSRMG